MAPATNMEGLRQLQWAQFTSIPFENLDIQLGRVIDLSRRHLVEKLVMSKRGGYCFELNGLMLRVLVTLGFKARPLLARVHLGHAPSGRTHQLTLVDLGSDPVLVDVGFGGGGPRCPIPFREGETQSDIDIRYRLTQRKPWGWLLETFDQTWKESYSFDTSHVIQSDIDLGNHYTSTSPNTHFTQIRTLSLPTSLGRISLRNHTFTRIEGHSILEETWPDGSAYMERLETHFGIVLDQPYDALKPV